MAWLRLPGHEADEDVADEVEVVTEAVGRGITPAISPSTIRRILVRDTLKPWQHQSWIFIRDPQFAGKAGRVLDLYARRYDGVPLGEGEYVISSDEKHPGPRRRHRTAPAASPRLVGLVGAGVLPAVLAAYCFLSGRKRATWTAAQES